MNNLQNLEKFIKYDLEIKKMLIRIAPDESYISGMSNFIKYLDILEESLKAMKVLFKKLASLINNSELDSKIDKQFKSYQFDLLKSMSYKKIIEFYKNDLTSMSQELINDVSTNFIGYLINRKSISEFMDKKLSINELLHVFHSYVMNNEKIYNDMPVLNKKEIGDSEITCYGQESNLANQIYSSIKENIGGIVDILSLPNNNKIIMMVRGRGHALTIDIDIDKDICYVKYFIPKLCNIEMINNLPGVNKVNKESNFTNGEFSISTEELPNYLYNFIKMVPTDFDMIIDSNQRQR